MTPKVGQRVAVESTWFVPWLGKEMPCYREVTIAKVSANRNKAAKDVTKHEVVIDGVQTILHTYAEQRRKGDPTYTREDQEIMDALEAFEKERTGGNQPKA